MDNVFKWKITQFTFIDNNFKQKRNKYDKNAHKMSVVYFKEGAEYFQWKTAAVNLISTVHCYNQGTMTKWKQCGTVVLLQLQ